MAGILRKATLTRPPGTESGGPFWPDARARINTGRVLPVVSNETVAALFGVGPGEIARAWAADIQSPLSNEENGDLGRVAQYHAICLKAPAEAKRQYLEAIKGYLVTLAQEEGRADPEIVEAMLDGNARSQVTFSALAAQLGYPYHPDPAQNPLRLLAELPLPVYLTTSPHRFLEYELARTGSRDPVTAVFYWDDGLRFIPSIFDQEPDYTPSRERPLVYHLFGLDDYPESLVLTEDDHLDYLVKLATLSYAVKHTDTNYDIPAVVTLALTGKALLLLGFQVTGWDFRVLFKGLVQATQESRLWPGVAMQLSPADAARRQELCDYLAGYFSTADFSVYWGDLHGCVATLYRLWQGGSA